MDRALGWRVRAKGGIFLKIISVKRGNTALCIKNAASGCQILLRLHSGARARVCVKSNRVADSTHITISGPKELLTGIEGEGCDDRGHRLPARWREELTTQLHNHSLATCLHWVCLCCCLLFLLESVAVARFLGRPVEPPSRVADQECGCATSRVGAWGGARWGGIVGSHLVPIRIHGNGSPVGMVV